MSARGELDGAPGGRGAAWWIGDWLRYGNTQYGEKYTRAAQITGYDTKSLRNMVYVASRFDKDRRHGRLSWSHHAAVASLPAEEQDRWLALAEQERLSVRSLRVEISNSRTCPELEAAPADRAAAAASEPATEHHTCRTPHEGHDPAVCCPECGCEFTPSPEELSARELQPA